MTSNSFETTDVDFSVDVELKKPSKALFILGVLSVLLGIFVGFIGISSTDSASNFQEYLFGFSGYILSAIIPIILLQVITLSDKKAISNIQDEPYDIFAGQTNKNRFLKVVLVGLISAALSIWVFLQPIAELAAT